MDRMTKPTAGSANATASAIGATPLAETPENLPSVLNNILAALYEHDAAPLVNRICPNFFLYVEALGKHCTVHQINGTLPLNTLSSEAESQLPGTFVRTHRSYLVNAEHVMSIERYQLTLSDGTKLPVPKQRYDQVRCEFELRVVDS